MHDTISNRLAAVSIRDLMLVDAVARQGSFSQAAGLMGISASGLSHQIRKVEDILGIAIFERGASITPTASGQQVLEATATILESVTRLEALRHRPAMPFGAVLRIGMISSLAPGALLGIVETCHCRSRRTRVEIVSGRHDALLRRLQGREIDLMITAEPDIPDGFSQAELFRESFALLVNAALDAPRLEPVCAAGPGLLPIGEDDFVPPCLALRLAGLLNSSLDRACGLSVEHRIALVSAGYGHALLPEGWTRGLSAHQTLTIVDLPAKLSAERTLRCVWRKSYPLGHEIAEMLHDAHHKVSAEQPTAEAAAN